MSNLIYDGGALTTFLTSLGISHRDVSAVGSLMLFLKSDCGVFMDKDFCIAIPFLKTSTIKDLLDRLVDGKIIKISKCESDGRIRVITWLIDWAQFVIEIKS